MKITIIFAISIWWSSVQLLGTANATVYHQQVGSVACDWRRYDNVNWKMCVTPFPPQFNPNQGFSKVFNVAVKVKDYDATFFGGYAFKTLSLGDWPIKSVDAISHVYGSFYIKSHDNHWMKKGEFGPFWMRRLNDPKEDYRMFSKLPGFVSYDAQTSLAVFRFFIMDPQDTEVTIADWKSKESGKTVFELGVSLASTCMDGFYTNATTEDTRPERCVTDDTAVISGYMNNYLMKTASPMSGTVEKAELKNTTLDFVYKWSQEESAMYTKARVTDWDNLKPQIKVLLIDSNPGTHGQDGVDTRDQKNVKVRAVLASFAVFPTWNTATDKIQDTYSLTLASGGFKEEQLTDFLWKYAASDHQGIDSVYYGGWKSETGLSMAISVCMVQADTSDRDAGCRQWKISPVKILDRNPQPTSSV